MHYKLASLLVGGAVTISFLSIIWLCGTLVNSTTMFYEEKDHLNLLGELPLPMALRDESTHKRGQLSLLQFSQWNVLTDQGDKGSERSEGGEYKPSSVNERDSLHETNQESIVDGQKNIYDHFKVAHKKQEAQRNQDVNDNTDSEPERTSPFDYGRATNTEIWLLETEAPKGEVEEMEEIKKMGKEAPSLVATTTSSQVERVVFNVDTKSQEKEALLDVPVSMPGSFEIRQPFSLPVPFAALPLDQILHTEWLQALKDFLHTLKPDSGPVTIVSSDYKYSEVLLNWLISALVRVDRPLSNVLVLSLDSSLHALLQRRGFACIHVPPESLVRPALIAKLKYHVAFTQVHILRLTVMRFVNHWGFDVANYDTDAIILKNPEPLYYKQYRDSDFIGSYGHFPQEMQQEWGIAVCIGVMMTKSSKQTEQYWESMSKVLPETTNDQARLNVALKAMDIKWTNSPIGARKSILREAWQGGGRGGFTATVLPSIVVCRGGCSRHFRSYYYVWHKGGKQTRDGKWKYAAGAGLWYLRTDWMAISNRTADSGQQWLKAIAIH